MEIIEHFSHEHPLSFFEDNDYEDHKPYFCSICGLPILSTPSYVCSNNGCKFFLHKPCAELPRLLEEPRHHPVEPLNPHSLSLEEKSSGQENVQNFIYKCHNCEFDIHPLVAVPVEIKIKLKSHQSHTLVAICRETLSLCDACGEKQNGFFFSCQECHFWIHQDCTLLPTILKLPSHSDDPFILTYSVFYEHRLITTCIICQRFMLRKTGIYYCSESNSFAHVKCAMSNSENLKTETRSAPEVIQLPDEGDTFPSLVIRKESSIPDHHKKLKIKKYHKHPNLILHDDGFISTNSSASGEACDLVCDVCIRPINISSPFYSCHDCDFLVHNICANPFSSASVFIEHGFTRASLCSDQSEWYFNSVFFCSTCNHPCNGFGYYIDYEESCHFIELECMYAPNTIRHSSHEEHVLLRTSRLPAKTNPFSCCSVKFHDRAQLYRCVICDFCIHLRCALLPKRTRHKFDDHPLYLIMTTSHAHDNDPFIHEQEYRHCFCEVCEKSINQQYWYYGCTECEHYFHINCIPSVGYLSKVKFGRTLNIPCHIHPATLTRMLSVVNQRCGYCHQIIKGYVDDMAFHCSHCDFWIHFSCARDSASSCATDDNKTPTKLMVYWEANEYARLLRDMIVNID